MNYQLAVVFNESELPELIHEVINPRASRPDHVRKRFLTDRFQHWVCFVAFFVSSEQEKYPRQSLLAGMKNVVYKLVLHSPIPGQQVIDKVGRKCGVAHKQLRRRLIVIIELGSTAVAAPCDEMDVKGNLRQKNSPDPAAPPAVRCTGFRG